MTRTLLAALLLATAALASPRPRADQPAARTRDRRRPAPEGDLRGLCRLGAEGIRLFPRTRRARTRRPPIWRGSTSATQLQRASITATCLRRCGRFRWPELSPAERDNAAVLTTMLEEDLRRSLSRMGNAGQFGQQLLDLSRRARPLLEDADYRRYIARMRDLPRFFDEQIANMRAGLARGFASGRDHPGREDRSRRSSEPVKNAFYSAFKSMPGNIGAADSRASRRGARRSSRRSSPLIASCSISGAPPMCPVRARPFPRATCPTATPTTARRSASSRRSA